MIVYLSGCANARVAEAARQRPNLGALAQPGNSVHVAAGDYPVWAADNGCFAKGDAFDVDAYLAWLAKLPHRETLLFAVAPDVVGDHVATYARAVPVLPRIRALGIRVAYVAQDGCEGDLDALPWDELDVLFVGGSTEWKLGAGARAVVAAAKARGKWVHMGRVNSRKRLRYAEAIGCDSADGTFLAFGPDTNLPRLLGWLDERPLVELAS